MFYLLFSKIMRRSFTPLGQHNIQSDRGCSPVQPHSPEFVSYPSNVSRQKLFISILKAPFMCNQNHRELPPHFHYMSKNFLPDFVPGCAGSYTKIPYLDLDFPTEETLKKIF